MKLILLLVLIFLVLLSGCTEEKTIEPHILNTNNSSKDSSDFQELPNEGSINLTPSSEPILQNSENTGEYLPEFSLDSFTWLYTRDNNNKNPKPLFNWDDVPGKDSDTLREYIKKWNRDYQWIDKAILTKTDEFKFGWDDVPGNGNESFIDFLARDYGTPWLPDMKIEKSDFGKRIEVTIDNRNISFSLNEDKTRALLRIDNTEIEEFKAKLENGKLNIYSNNRTIQIGNGLNITLISNNSAFLSFGEGAGIRFPVKEINGNFFVYDINYLQDHDISERRYAVYNLSIKNNGSETYQFKLHKLRLNTGTGLSIPAYMDAISNYPMVGTKLGDVSILPGQTTQGYVVFNIGSIYNKSFLLTYNSKPVSLASFENSVLSIEKADLFDYSIAMGKPPYHISDFGSPDTYDPPPPEFYTHDGGAYSLIWSNWANRSVVEYFKKLDLKELNNIKRDNDLPSTYSTYSIKAISGKNISIHPGNQVVITGEQNEELISGYYNKMAVSENLTFRQFNGDFANEINYSNATIVKILFDNIYGWNMASRINRNDQLVILDENRNIVITGFHYSHFVS